MPAKCRHLSVVVRRQLRVLSSCRTLPRQPFGFLLSSLRVSFVRSGSWSRLRVSMDGQWDWMDGRDSDATGLCFLGSALPAVPSCETRSHPTWAVPPWWRRSCCSRVGRELTLVSLPGPQKRRPCFQRGRAMPPWRFNLLEGVKRMGSSRSCGRSVVRRSQPLRLEGQSRRSWSCAAVRQVEVVWPRERRDLGGVGHSPV